MPSGNGRYVYVVFVFLSSSSIVSNGVDRHGVVAWLVGRCESVWYRYNNTAR